MNYKISTPKILEAAGKPPKRIEEYIGRVATGQAEISIARMVSPGGWAEPTQCPEFDEYTIVLKGELHLTLDKGETVVIKAGQAILVTKGTQVQYSTPTLEGAEYMAICLPAFSPTLVHRQE